MSQDKEFTPVKKVHQVMMQLYGFKTSYPSITYYRDLSLLPDGVKEGKTNLYKHKETYYQIRIIRLISGMFGKGLKEIAVIASDLPKKTLYMMPAAFIKICAEEISLETDAETLLKIKDKFWEVIMETTSSGEGSTAEHYYNKIVRERFKKEVAAMVR